MSKQGSVCDTFPLVTSHRLGLSPGWFTMVGVAGLLVVDLLAGCGKAGSPIPPEDIGIAAKLEKERQQAQRVEGKDREKERQLAEPGTRLPEEEAAQEDIRLPPLRPIGTQ